MSVAPAVVEPATAEEVAATLARASREKLRVAIQGGGTKLGWGPTPAPVDLVLSTRRLNAVVAHRHGDLTATVQAGATLADVNRELARQGQWIPLDPPWADGATVGGIIATNDSGPRRHRFGAPRDLIIGVEIARADGVLAKSGGIVVKNVAGYDLSRLVTGSFGTLAVVVTATFKLYPVPQASRTLVVDGRDASALGATVSALLASQVTPTAIELGTAPLRLLVRFESIAAAAEQQARNAARLVESTDGKAAVVRGAEETTLWTAHSVDMWGRPGAILKVTQLPTELAPTLTWLNESMHGADWEMVGRAGLGVLLLRIDADVATQARLIASLRTRFPHGRGSAVLVRGSDELKASLDVWGPSGDSLALMRAVKQQFDPDGILNPGRSPFGL